MPKSSKTPAVGRVGWIVVAAALGVLGSGCPSPDQKAVTAAPAPATDDPALVRLDAEAADQAGLTLVKVREDRIERTVETAGRVVVNEEATARVGSFAEGQVIECCEPVGQFVRQGQVLARIHSHDAHDAESAHRRAHEDLLRRHAELTYARQEYNRASRLHELRAGSLASLQEAEAHLRAAETAEVIAESELRRAESHLRYLGLTPPQLDHRGNQGGDESHADGHELHPLEVRSPIAGTIIERLVSRGNVVTPADPLYVISDLSRLWAIAQVPETYLPDLRRGMPVEVIVDAYPGRSFAARVSWINDALDPQTRTVQVRCDLSNSGRELKTEMWATIRFRFAATSLSLVAPRDAIQTIDGRSVVFVEESVGVYRRRDVELGHGADSEIEVRSGLAAGENVVAHGSFLLKSELLKARFADE